MEIGELPAHLVERILLCLPIDSLIECRSVCKEWKSLICSTRFATTICRDTPCPWTLLRQSDFNSILCINSQYILYYSFSTKSGRIISECALPKQFSIENMNDDCLGSASGFFLIGKNYLDDFRHGGGFVWNPVGRGEVSVLPSFKVAGRHLKEIGILCDGESTENYKVVSIGLHREGGGKTIEIYHSLEKSWRTVTVVPRDFGPLVVGPINLIFLDDMLFCTTDYSGSPGKMMIYDLLQCEDHPDEVPVLVPLPQYEVDLDRYLDYELVACRSAVLLTVVEFRRESDCENSVTVEGGADSWPRRPSVVHVWKLDVEEEASESDKEGGTGCFIWKEVATMPPSLLALLIPKPLPLRCPSTIRCVGVGDHVCFTHLGSENRTSGKEVVTYDLSSGKWTSLPSIVLAFTSTSMGM